MQKMNLNLFLLLIFLFVCFHQTGCSNPAENIIPIETEPTEVYVTVSIDTGFTDTTINHIDVINGRTYLVPLNRNIKSTWHFNGRIVTCYKHFSPTTTKVRFKADGAGGELILE